MAVTVDMPHYTKSAMCKFCNKVIIYSADEKKWYHQGDIDRVSYGFCGATDKKATPKRGTVTGVTYVCRFCRKETSETRSFLIPLFNETVTVNAHTNCSNQTGE